MEKLDVYEKSFKFWSESAVKFDRDDQSELAKICYREALHVGSRIMEIDADNLAGSEMVFIKTTLQHAKNGQFPPHDKEIYADLALEQAMTFDEAGLSEEAKRLYTFSSKSYVELAKTNIGSTAHRSKANKILTRLEKMAGITAPVTTPPRAASPPKPVPRTQPSPTTTQQPAPRAPSPIRTNKLGELDQKVLMRSGVINGNMFHPFTSQDEYNEVKVSNQVWSDPMGPLPLSAKQKQNFSGWIRLPQFVLRRNIQNPRMVGSVSPYLIEQTIVADCSFVCSLIVSANYEIMFRRQLITEIIYPKNEKGIPVYNPAGKYMVKIWFNGVARKVLVDDTVPMGSNGNIMCSYSTALDFWVTIIEKAYVKINGGYDFPGSNGGIDLYSLTGWIPQNHSTKKLNKEQVWAEMSAGFKRGSALVTVATPSYSPGEEKKYGLVSSHAYAMLDCKDVNGLKLMKIKNPWNSQSWNGRYSFRDTKAMTPGLKQLLNFTEQEDKGGIFWIDFDTFCTYFEGIYVNWNPGVLKNQVAIHRPWISYGPADDSIIQAYNPQYRLTISVKDKIASKPNKTYTYGVIWVVLSRHILHKTQILSPQKKDYLTLHVYDRRDGELILNTGKALVTGIYSNNPHVLCRLQVPVGVVKYTLVVSAFEKDNKQGMNYSLQVYSTENCFPAPQLEEIQNTLAFTQKMNSQWTTETAGGGLSSRNYLKNPMFFIEVSGQSMVRIRLMTHKQLYCNIAFHNCRARQDVSHENRIKDSGAYREGFCYVEIPSCPPGKYAIVPSLFDAGATGVIILEFECNAKFVASVCA